MPTERIESLDYAERWFRDGLRSIESPGCLLVTEVDMSGCAALRASMSKLGTPVTYTHLLVHAAAATLTQYPELHRLLAGNKRLFPGTVDICLSISGDSAVTPVLIVKDAGTKSLPQIAEEVRNRAGHARSEEEKRLRVMRRWGWVVPFRALRRATVRLLLNRLWYRRLVSGTFQISSVPTVDLMVPMLFNTAAALGAGRVRDRVVAVEGRVEIRPTLLLACCCDHTVWNGLDTAQFLNGVKARLEAA